MFATCLQRVQALQQSVYFVYLAATVDEQRLSKVGNLWKWIPSVWESLSFEHSGAEHQLPLPALLVFFGLYHLQPYSVTICTWLIINGSLWCTVTVPSRDTFQLFSHTWSVFAFKMYCFLRFALDRKADAPQVHRLHMWPVSYVRLCKQSNVLPVRDSWACFTAESRQHPTSRSLKCFVVLWLTSLLLRNEPGPAESCDFIFFFAKLVMLV